MKQYKFEYCLDKLLNYYASQGSSTVVPSKNLPDEFHTIDLLKMLDILEFRGFIAPFTQVFSDGKPTTFYQVKSITSAGVYFCHNSSFVKEALLKDREERRTNFEAFKMGWDTVIALFSLVISIVAIFIASK